MCNHSSNIKKMHIFSLLTGMHFVGGVLIPFFMGWGGLTFTELMILQSIFAFSIVIFEVPTGAIADRFGRKISLIIGAIGNVIAMGFYSVYPSFILFAIGECLWAFGTSLLSGAREAIIYDSLKISHKEQISKRILGRFNGFHLTGIMIAGPIGSLIAYYIGVRYSMLFSAVPFILAITIALFLKEPPTEYGKKKISYLKTIKEGIFYFRHNRPLLILAIDAIIIHTMVFMIIWMYQPLLQRLGVSIAFFGLVHAGIAGMEVIVFNRFHHLEKIMGSNKRYIFASSLITGVSFAILGFFRTIEVVVIFIVIIGGFGLTRYGILSNYMNKHIPSYKRATVLSSVSMFTRLFQGLLYPIVGIMVDISLAWAFVTIGIVIMAFSFISMIKEEHLLD